MPTALIVSLVVIGILLIVGTAYSIQIMEKNNREKRRLMFSLRERAESFKVMLESFPQGFLTPDLQVLMCKCLIDILEQLLQIDKANRAQHSQSINQVTSHLEQLKANGASGGYQSLSDPKHVQQVQKLLSTVYNFIVKLRQSNQISEAEATSYAKQIRRLNVVSSLDAFRFAKQAAMKEGKPRLALHYQTMSIDKMKKENSDGFFSERIAAFESQLAEFETAIETHENAPKQAAAAQGSEEWAKFEEQNQQQEQWKKKAIYD
jgi:hypothetical protein